MVGGKVIYICRVRKRFHDGIHWVLSVWCVEGTDETAVYVDDSCPVQPGDSVWWQGRKAFWTPADKSKEDVAFVRYGYSHDPFIDLAEGDVT